MKSLSKGLRLRFFLSFLLVIGSVFISLYTLNKLNDYNRQATEIHNKLETIKEIKFLHRDAVANVRGYVLTHDNAFLENYKKDYPQFVINYNILYQNSGHDKVFLKNLEKLKSLIDERLGILNLIIQVYYNGGNDFNGLTRYGHSVTSNINSLTKKIEVDCMAQISVINEITQKFRVYTFLVTTLSYLFAFILLFFTGRELVKTSQKEKNTKKLLQEAQALSKIGNYEWLPHENKLFWSDELYRIYGYEPDELPLAQLSLLQQKVIYPEDVEYHSRVMKRLLEKEGAYAFDWRIIRKNKSIGWVHGVGESIFGKNGKVERVYGYLQDVTEQKEKEEQLQEARETLQKLNSELEEKVEKRTLELEEQNKKLLKSIEQQIYFRDQIKEKEETLELAIQSTDIGTWDYFPLEKFLKLSDRTRELFGIRSEGKISFDEFIEKAHVDDRQKLREAMTQALQPSGNGKLNIEFRTTSSEAGGSRWVNARGRVLFDKGQAFRFIGIAHDISPARQLAEKKDEFIGIASHELKTPITSMKAYLQIVELMLKEKKYENVENFVKKAHNHVEKLTNLVNELLDVTKIQAGKMQLNIIEFDLDELIEETIKNIQYSTSTHKIIKEGNLGKIIRGDKGRIEQVMTNYLTNAVKYSPSADKVIVNVVPKDNFVEVSVHDFGIGIPAHKVPHLFEKFYRVEENSKKFAGLGLGLNIASEIVKRHGGNAWAESEFEKGSVFYFTLPV